MPFERSCRLSETLIIILRDDKFSQEMHLKIPLLSQGLKLLKLLNSKPGCRVSALNFFVK